MTFVESRCITLRIRLPPSHEASTVAKAMADRMADRAIRLKPSSLKLFRISTPLNSRFQLQSEGLSVNKGLEEAIRLPPHLKRHSDLQQPHVQT